MTAERLSGQEATGGRGIALYWERGHEIRQIGPDEFVVPASDGTGEYVANTATGACECPSHEFNLAVTCKHAIAATLFQAKAGRGRVHACVDGTGLVFLTHIVDGEEVTTSTPCLACQEEAS